MAHADYLQLLSMTSVFLNTFPFGAGITSSEAISVCLPVVVLADTSSVLHLALAQVRKLGKRWSDEWIVHSREEFVMTSVRIANLPNLLQYRQDVCADRPNLLGETVLHEAVDEWDKFGV